VINGCSAFKLIEFVAYLLGFGVKSDRTRAFIGTDEYNTSRSRRPSGADEEISALLEETSLLFALMVHSTIGLN